jgi:hypothetical protein
MVYTIDSMVAARLGYMPCMPPEFPHEPSPIELLLRFAPAQGGRGASHEPSLTRHT